jgi:bla regulator protein blaR1
MTVHSIDAFLRNAWPSIANHLWQSTLFAAAVAVLVLLLRKNHASTRYALWLCASLKFLLPFSLLISAGTRFGFHEAPTSSQSADLLIVMQDLGQPFAPTHFTQHTQAISSLSAAELLPLFVALLWLTGFLTMVFYWLLRLHRLSTALHSTASATGGREHDALRSIEPAIGISKPTRLVLSHTSVEPGILGIFRATLVLPAGISDRLTESQIKSVLLHELCHVRRRDNLTAALHMLVEALFWFHPLVWWVGARLIDERERACDEEVLCVGSDPQTYAEGILKICEFYLESPVVCASGVTGSNLKKRIEAIMQNRVPLDLSVPRKLLLCCSAFLGIAAPVVFGLLHAAQIRTIDSAADPQTQSAVGSQFAFSETLIKPSNHGIDLPTLGHGPQPGFTDMNVTLRTLIRVAYGVQYAQIIGGPDWVGKQKYDIEAKVDESSAEEMEKLSPDQLRLENKRMLQVFLASHFQLAVHRETRELPVYALMVADGGAKLAPASQTDTPAPSGFPRVKGFGIGIGNGKLTARSSGIGFFTDILAGLPGVNRIVVDKTGLNGKYDFTLAWTSDTSVTPPSTTLFSALEQQLGLKLQPQTSPVEVLVIDHAELAAEQPAGVAQGSTPVLKKAAFQRSNSDTPESPFASISIQLDREAPGMLNFGWFRPDTFTTKGSTLNELIREAYGVQREQIIGSPQWASSDRYNIKATFTESELAIVKSLDSQSGDRECLHTLQRLLAERFDLALHAENRLVPAYVLQTWASGSKLHAATPGDTYPAGLKDMNGKGHGNVIHFGPGEYIGQGVPISDLVTLLAMQHLDRVIADKTGLAGNYDFKVQWTAGSRGGTPDPALVKALEEQLGLTLEARDAMIPVLVVDRASQPSEE